MAPQLRRVVTFQRDLSQVAAVRPNSPSRLDILPRCPLSQQSPEDARVVHGLCSRDKAPAQTPPLSLSCRTPLKLADFIVMKKVGGGPNSKVYRAEHRESSLPVALKVYSLHTLKRQEKVRERNRAYAPNGPCGRLRDPICLPAAPLACSPTDHALLRSHPLQFPLLRANSLPCRGLSV